MFSAPDEKVLVRVLPDLYHAISKATSNADWPGLHPTLTFLARKFLPNALVISDRSNLRDPSP